MVLNTQHVSKLGPFLPAKAPLLQYRKQEQPLDEGKAETEKRTLSMRACSAIMDLHTDL
jgi:hypothetical protein